ncbi:hypothetical protein ACFQJC_13355 [Haloferax namakaokahaiae]|uniref:Uncharacterized protein n=1 Tax=Haloferax namakaokahaiae TaxID=1748331 RepID=A0ABD5ZH03_9EURY
MSRRRNGADSDRGQLVLVSGAVAAVALLALVLVHAQLAYAPTEAATSANVDEISSATEQSVAAATLDVSGRFSWGAQQAAVSDFTSRLDPSLERIERAYTGPGGVSISRNDSAAAGWALSNCPSGPYRAFGNCVADDGVVVQDRAGETTIVAVLVDIDIATLDRRAELTLAVRPV